MIIARAAAFLEKGLAALDFPPVDKLCLTGGVRLHYRGYLLAQTVENVVAPQGNAMQGAFALARQAAQQKGYRPPLRPALYLCICRLIFGSV